MTFSLFFFLFFLLVSLPTIFLPPQERDLYRAVEFHLKRLLWQPLNTVVLLLSTLTNLIHLMPLEQSLLQLAKDVRTFLLFPSPLHIANFFLFLFLFLSILFSMKKSFLELDQTSTRFQRSMTAKLKQIRTGGRLSGSTWTIMNFRARLKDGPRKVWLAWKPSSARKAHLESLVSLLEFGRTRNQKVFILLYFSLPFL